MLPGWGCGAEICALLKEVVKSNPTKRDKIRGVRSIIGEAHLPASLDG
jgi:hypothetical protein